mmetsp:Transcript_8851/g.27643  ORF Transcript_8851/g.27643 Transcript_8851/m.27643 type:complete len:224 (+) Transcript_8851:998-1669(+)
MRPRLLCAAAVVACVAASDITDDAKRAARDADAPAGNFASHACHGPHNPRTQKLNKLCEAFAIHWDFVAHDLHDICHDHTGDEEGCPDDITPDLPYWAEYKKESLRLDAPLYDEEAKMADLLNRRKDARRLRRLAEVHRATYQYELDGDGEKLAELLEAASAKERRGFMTSSKAPKMTELFKRAEAEGISVMELLRREGASLNEQKSKRRRRRRRRRRSKEEL